MCLSSPKAPPAPLPPPVPPPPPEPTPEAPVINATSASGRSAAKSKASGTRSLQIALNIAQPSGQGLNIPQA